MKIYAIRYSREAGRSLKKLNPTLAKRLVTKIEALATNPRPTGSKKLVQRGDWRLRVGDYRVLYEIKDTEVTVLVVRVAHRREVYR